MICDNYIKYIPRERISSRTDNSRIIPTTEPENIQREITLYLKKTIFLHNVQVFDIETSTCTKCDNKQETKKSKYEMERFQEKLTYEVIHQGQYL